MERCYVQQSKCCLEMDETTEREESSRERAHRRPHLWGLRLGKAAGGRVRAQDEGNYKTSSPRLRILSSEKKRRCFLLPCTGRVGETGLDSESVSVSREPVSLSKPICHSALESSRQTPEIERCLNTTLNSSASAGPTGCRLGRRCPQTLGW